MGVNNVKLNMLLLYLFLTDFIMKYILTLIITLLTISLFAQAEDQNFYLVDANMSWQKAYSTDKSKDQVLAYFENSDIFKKVVIENGQIVGKLDKHAVDPNKTGIPGVPPIINKTDFIGDIVIRYRAKEKDYVVQFTNLTMVGRGDLLKKNEEQVFEVQFVSKSSGKYRPGFLKRPKEVYNTTFTPIFEMK